jgi:hypothetical protein
LKNRRRAGILQRARRSFEPGADRAHRPAPAAAALRRSCLEAKFNAEAYVRACVDLVDLCAAMLFILLLSIFMVIDPGKTEPVTE